MENHAAERHVLAAERTIGPQHALCDRREPHILADQSAHSGARLGGRLLRKSHTGQRDCEFDGTIHGTTD